MPLKLNSTGGGSVTVDVPNTASTYTATIPATTGTVVVASSTGTTSIDNLQINGTLVQGSSFLRNRIINGDMRIDQRNAGASVTPTSDPTYTVDRWSLTLSQASKFTIQQNAGSVARPAGYTNYLGATVAASVTVGASDYFSLYQPIEGFNVSDLNYGSASAVTTTLSFWVRSSLTGTFGGAIRNSTGNRSYPFTYTISSANTWEQKTVTIPGDTSAATDTTNGSGLIVRFGLGAGSTFSGTAGSWATGNFMSATGATSVVGTNGATFYLTGVQLEVGSVATPFERRQYGQELALCQRYFQTAGSGASGSFDGSTTTIQITEKLMPTMRTAPTASIRSGVTAAFRSVASDFNAASPGLANYQSQANAIGEGIAFWTQVTGFTGGTSNAVATSRNNVSTNGGAFINLSAEL